MILAAGYGKRMRDYDASVPKPLVKIADKALIDWSFDLLGSSGVEEAVVNTSHMAEMLEAHLLARPSPLIHISREAEPLETGGGIAKAMPLLGNTPFFSLNSDVICRDAAIPCLQRMAQMWEDAQMDALLLLIPKENAIGYDGAGDFFLHEDGALQRRGDAQSAPYIFSGVQLLHPRLFVDVPERAFSMNVLYNRGISREGRLYRVCGLVHDGEWFHVGNAQGVKQAQLRLCATPG